MPINPENFEMAITPVQYEKKEIPTIIEESQSIDVEESAREILTWAANNVEQFIDNQKKIFKLDIVIDAEEGATETMPVTRRLQNLYRALPDDPELSITEAMNEDTMSMLDNLTDEQNELIGQIQQCKATLDTITNDIFLCMRSNEELLAALFKRMAFYYEMQGISQGNLLIEELTGEVDVSKFEYEQFPVGVQVTAPIIEKMDEDGNVTEEGGNVVNEYVIPEGFTMWLEIAFKSKQKNMQSLF